MTFRHGYFGIIFAVFGPPEMMVSVLRAGVLKDVSQFASNSFGSFYGSFHTPKKHSEHIMELESYDLPKSYESNSSGSCISCYHHEDGVRLT